MKIDHIGIATRATRRRTRRLARCFRSEVDATEAVAEQGVRVAMLPIGETHIELLEPLSENSPVGKFLDKRGPGIHHVAISVADIRASLAQLKEKGARLIDETPRRRRRWLSGGICSPGLG